MSTAWMLDAACRGVATELFFPTREEPPMALEARAVCARCPVRQECLDYALDGQEHYGIWGGTSERQRRRMRRVDRQQRTEESA